MHTSPSFDWQVFEEKDWEDAVVSGVLAANNADDQALKTILTATADAPSRSANLPWLSIAGVVVAVIVLWLAYTPWSAKRAEAMPLADDNAALTTLVQIEAKDGRIRFAQVDSALHTPRRLHILSDYFQFEYDLYDQGAVIAAAAQIDPLYRALRQSVGLGEPADVIRIEVLPRTITSGWQLSADRVLIPSPTFSQLPSATAAETLLHSLRVALIHVVLAEEMTAAPIHPKWNFLVDGVRKWLETCHDAQDERHCADRLGASTVLNATPPMTLADLTFTDSDWVATTWRTERVHGAKWLVAYIVDAYGMEMLPALLAGLRQHDSWQALIPAVFGLSVEQFEQDWQQAAPLPARNKGLR